MSPPFVTGIAWGAYCNILNWTCYHSWNTENAPRSCLLSPGIQSSKSSLDPRRHSDPSTGPHVCMCNWMVHVFCRQTWVTHLPSPFLSNPNNLLNIFSLNHFFYIIKVFLRWNFITTINKKLAIIFMKV